VITNSHWSLCVTLSTYGCSDTSVVWVGCSSAECTPACNYQAAEQAEAHSNMSAKTLKLRLDRCRPTSLSPWRDWKLELLMLSSSSRRRYSGGRPCCCQRCEGHYKHWCWWLLLCGTTYFLMGLLRSADIDQDGALLSLACCESFPAPVR
jgi:hypothetical protein